MNNFGQYGREPLFPRGPPPSLLQNPGMFGSNHPQQGLMQTPLIQPSLMQDPQRSMAYGQDREFQSQRPIRGLLGDPPMGEQPHRQDFGKTPNQFSQQSGQQAFQNQRAFQPRDTTPKPFVPHQRFPQPTDRVSLMGDRPPVQPLFQGTGMQGDPLFPGGLPSRGGSLLPGGPSPQGAPLIQDKPAPHMYAGGSETKLDDFNSDLNLMIDRSGYGAAPLNKPNGFCFCWAGARATHGVSTGKVCFDVRIIENLQVDFGEDHQEEYPHVVRVGWSTDSSSLQLGEEMYSYGFGGTGKFCESNKFSNYGIPYQVGDTITAMLDFVTRPPKISFCKNGNWLGVATTLFNFKVGDDSNALFPHILSKNCRFEVNFGQRNREFPDPPGFTYIDHSPTKVRGMEPNARKQDCEIIMVVGLPGAGKTTLAFKAQKDHPEKRYTIIGTDTLIDKMKVMGLPRRRNYHGRWDKLISMASAALNALFRISAKKNRNYILDQTNVYPTAQKRKMSNYVGFKRLAWVLVTPDTELVRRSEKRTVEDGKVVPESAILEMKANFKLPPEKCDFLDEVVFIELDRRESSKLVDMYNNEGNKNRPPRDVVFQPKHDRFMGQKPDRSDNSSRSSSLDENRSRDRSQDINASDWKNESKNASSRDRNESNSRDRYSSNDWKDVSKNTSNQARDTDRSRNQSHARDWKEVPKVTSKSSASGGNNTSKYSEREKTPDMRIQGGSREIKEVAKETALPRKNPLGSPLRSDKEGTQPKVSPLGPPLDGKSSSPKTTEAKSSKSTATALPRQKTSRFSDNTEVVKRNDSQSSAKSISNSGEFDRKVDMGTKQSRYDSSSSNQKSNVVPLLSLSTAYQPTKKEDDNIGSRYGNRDSRRSSNEMPFEKDLQATRKQDDSMGSRYGDRRSSTEMSFGKDSAADRFKEFERGIISEFEKKGSGFNNSAQQFPTSNANIPPSTSFGRTISQSKSTEYVMQQAGRNLQSTSWEVGPFGKRKTDQETSVYEPQLKSPRGSYESNTRGNSMMENQHFEKDQFGTNSRIPPRVSESSNTNIGHHVVKKEPFTEGYGGYAEEWKSGYTRSMAGQTSDLRKVDNTATWGQQRHYQSQEDVYSSDFWDKGGYGSRSSASSNSYNIDKQDNISSEKRENLGKSSRWNPIEDSGNIPKSVASTNLSTQPSNIKIEALDSSVINNLLNSLKKTGGLDALKQYGQVEDEVIPARKSVKSEVDQSAYDHYSSRYISQGRGRGEKEESSYNSSENLEDSYKYGHQRDQERQVHTYGKYEESGYGRFDKDDKSIREHQPYLQDHRGVVERSREDPYIMESSRYDSMSTGGMERDNSRNKYPYDFSGQEKLPDYNKPSNRSDLSSDIHNVYKPPEKQAYHQQSHQDRSIPVHGRQGGMIMKMQDTGYQDKHKSDEFQDRYLDDLPGRHFQDDRGNIQSRQGKEFREEEHGEGKLYDRHNQIIIKGSKDKPSEQFWDRHHQGYMGQNVKDRSQQDTVEGTFSEIRKDSMLQDFPIQRHQDTVGRDFQNKSKEMGFQRRSQDYMIPGVQDRRRPDLMGEEFKDRHHQEPMERELGRWKDNEEAGFEDRRRQGTDGDSQRDLMYPSRESRFPESGFAPQHAQAFRRQDDNRDRELYRPRQDVPRADYGAYSGQNRSSRW